MNEDHKYPVLGSRLIVETPWVRITEDEIRKRGRVEQYVVVQRPSSVIVVPLSPSKKTLLLQQYRHPMRGCSWEFPMGGIDAGETPAGASRRELKEETSLEISEKELKQVGSYRAVPGLSPQEVFVFVALVDDVQLDRVKLVRNADDIVAVEQYTLEEVLRLAKSGGIVDGFTIAACFFLLVDSHY